MSDDPSAHDENKQLGEQPSWESADETVEKPADAIEPVPPSRRRFAFVKTKKMLVLTVLILVAAAATGYVLTSQRSEQSSNTSPASTTAKKVQALGAEVSLIEGVVEMSDDGTTWQAAKTGNVVKEGHHIRTGTGGRVVIALDEGSAIRLNKNSRVFIDSLTVDEVLLTNQNGEVYTRIVPVATRAFKVSANNDTYTAKGTAFKTVNTPEKSGVEVYHSAVKAGKADVEVKEGKTYFSLHQDKKLQNVLGDVNIEQLKNDEFIKWNLDQDKKDKDFAAALGVLKQLETPAPAPTPVATTPNGIVLSGQAGEGTATFSWTVKGINTSSGYKLVKSSKTSVPSYPDHSAAFIENGAGSYKLSVSDGGTYYFRLCAYRSNKTCDSYSNTVKLTIAAKPKQPVVAGALGLSINGTTASWTVGGTAPYGFKVLISDTSPPSIENHDYKKGTSTASFNLADLGLANGTWYIKVCKITYEGSGLTDCSDTATYIET